MSEEYYRTDLKENAIDDLEKLFKFLELTKEDESYWKWAIIALHSSLYKFMLLVLKNPDCSGIWEKIKKKKVGFVYKINFFNAENKLISFLKAFKWIQDTERMSGFVNSKAFISTPEIDEAMKRLNIELRNQLFHFKPKGWSVEILLIEEIIQKTLPIIKFIVFESGRVLIEENEQLTIDETFKKIILQSKV